MRLVVAKYEPDEHHSLDCILCDEEDQGTNLTVTLFHDEVNGTSLVLCPEHLNDMVVEALKRHRDGLKENDPFWYLTPDKDPWEEMWKEERQ